MDRIGDQLEERATQFAFRDQHRHLELTELFARHWDVPDRAQLTDITDIITVDRSDFAIYRTAKRKSFRNVFPA